MAIINSLVITLSRRGMGMGMGVGGGGGEVP
jgi:hypothetical protein